MSVEIIFIKDKVSAEVKEPLGEKEVSSFVDMRLAEIAHDTVLDYGPLQFDMVIKIIILSNFDISRQDAYSLYVDLVKHDIPKTEEEFAIAIKKLVKEVDERYDRIPF